MSTPVLKSDWVLKHIGNVGVDSGEISLHDPVHKIGTIEVTTPTAEGDGVYPVFQVYEGKALVGIFVGFMEEPPHEADGKVTLGNLEKT
jgi:hypothetical protein